MHFIISVLLVTSSFTGSAFSGAPRVKTEDLRRLTGARWSGTLTYLDYGRNKRVSIPSQLVVTQSAESKLSWVFEYRYPDEPKADSRDTLTIGEDGRTLDGETVIERTNLAGGAVRLVTEKTGTDNDKPATFHYTYLFAPKSLSIKKEVRYEGAGDFFERNLYSWTR